MHAYYLALKREIEKQPVEWMIINGANTGRWTRLFGVNCMADTYDAQLIIKNYKEEYSGKYELTIYKQQVELPSGITENGTAFVKIEGKA